MRGTYTRWTKIANGTDLTADILSSVVTIMSVPASKQTYLIVRDGETEVKMKLGPDEARLIGVRLIEGAALSDPQAVRELP